MLIESKQGCKLINQKYKEAMDKSRRQFLVTGLKVGTTLPFLGPLALSSSCNTPTANEAEQSNPSSKKLNILILGGTSFLGPHQIAYAMSRGHSITTFTRGRTKPTIHQNLFEKVEQLIGDRANNLEALRNRKWDAVIDNSGRNVTWTRDTATLLKDNVGLYLYTSSTGVYYPYLGNDIKEDTEVVLKVPEGIEGEETKLEYDYGVMKSNSELEAKKQFGEDRTIVVRPTYMVGPADKTDRFIYWPIRLSKGGEIMVPGKREDKVQLVDVRDVAGWMIRLIENKSIGTYNAVGPQAPTTMYSFVEEAAKAFEKEVSFVQIDDYEFLKVHQVHYIVPWIMPIGNNKGSALINNELALANGLTFIPLKETLLDTYNWWYSDALTEERRQQFEAKPNSILANEKNILEAWKKYQKD